MAVPAGVARPMHTDAYGTSEDDNGRADFAEVVLYFNQMGWIGLNKPVHGFDYNGNGRVDFADVVWLFNHL